MLPTLLFLALHPALATDLNPSQRGSRLYKGCQAGIRLADNTTVDSTSDAMDSNWCVAYINGMLDGLDVAGVKLVCADGATVGTMARVYARYMDTHPKLMDSAAGAGLFNALADAYPCRTR